MIIRTTQVLAIVAAAALSMPALATNSTPPAGCSHKGKPCNPTPSPTPSTTSTSSGASAGASSSAAALAGAAAGASVGNVGGGAAKVEGVSSSSAGGASDLQSDIDVNAAPALNDNSKSSAWSLFLPPPAWVPPMAPVDCASAMITQDSKLIAFNAYSEANAKTDTSDCTLIRLRNAKVESCQFGEAKQIEDLVVAKYLKDYKPGQVQMPNYSHAECNVLKAPPAPTPIATSAQLLPPAAPAAAASAAPLPVPVAAKPAPKKAAAKKRAAVPTPPACADGAVPQCKAPEKRT